MPKINEYDELDDLDRRCALEIMGWKEFKRGSIETYEPIGIPIKGFCPTRWIMDSFKIVDKISPAETSFTLVRNDDGSFTACFSSRLITKRITSPSPAYSVTVAALHYFMERGGANGKPGVLKTEYKR